MTSEVRVHFCIRKKLKGFNFDCFLLSNSDFFVFQDKRSKWWTMQLLKLKNIFLNAVTMQNETDMVLGTNWLIDCSALKIESGYRKQ